MFNNISHFISTLYASGLTNASNWSNVLQNIVNPIDLKFELCN